MPEQWNGSTTRIHADIFQHSRTGVETASHPRLNYVNRDREISSIRGAVPFNLVRHRGGLSKDRSLFSYNYKAYVNEIFFSFSYLKLLWRLSNIVHFSFRYVEWFLNRCFVFPFWNFDKDFGQEDRKFWAQVLKSIIHEIFRGGY